MDFTPITINLLHVVIYPQSKKLSRTLDLPPNVDRVYARFIREQEDLEDQYWHDVTHSANIGPIDISGVSNLFGITLDEDFLNRYPNEPGLLQIAYSTIPTIRKKFTLV